MINVGIVGFGTIGAVVGKSLDEGIPGLCLVAVASGHKEKAVEGVMFEEAEEGRPAEKP